MPFPIALGLGALISGGAHTLSRFLVGYIIVKVLFAFGITAFSIVGTEWLTSYIETEVISYTNSMTASISEILIMCGLLDAIQIIFNCWIAAINIKALKGTFKGMKFL